MNSCEAYIPIKRDAVCGDYLIDISASNAVVRFRPITTLKEGTSCTYRIFSTCGYPTLHWEIVDPRLSSSYDFAYATIANLALEDDIDDVLDFNKTTEWNGSAQTGTNLDTVRQSGAQVPQSEWDSCKSTPRNMWVTITRLPVTKAEENVGVISYSPNDIDLVFYNQRGSDTLATY